MCEFKVFKGGEVMFKDAVYARVDGQNVMVRDVFGLSMVFKDCTIEEVDVHSERLLLKVTKK